MSKSLATVVGIFMGLILCGCTASPWSLRKPIEFSPSPRASSRSAETPSSPAADNPVNAQDLQTVMNEVCRMGDLDPIAQGILLEDLRQSDPSIWPLVVRQARATAEYRRRAAQRKSTKIAATDQVERLPPTYPAGADPAPIGPEQTAVAATKPPPCDAYGLQTTALPNHVVQAAYTSPLSDDWRQSLSAAIASLESKVSKNPTTPAELADCARLQMLYAAAGRREDAIRFASENPTPSQQFLSKGIASMATWLDADRMPDDAARAAATKPVLVEALAKLAESAPLVVRNIAFCTEIRSFGNVKRFDAYEFEPNQETLLYVEIDNFALEPTPQGYHTSLRSCYQIFDQNRQPVAQHTFPDTEEYCQNLRRDFFIGYHLRIPENLTPGKYTLQLSIADLKCGKTGKGSIEFTVTEKKLATAETAKTEAKTSSK